MYMWKNESKIGKIKRALLEKHRIKLWKTRHINIKMIVEKENKTKKYRKCTNKQHFSIY